MKLAMFAAAATLALAACQEDKAQKALVDSCVADGLNQKTCTCLATETKKQVDPEVYEAMALAAQGKEDEANALMEKMPIEKRFSVASGITSAMGACAVEG